MNDKGIINIEPDSCVYNGNTKQDAIEIIDDDDCKTPNSTASSADSLIVIDSQSAQSRKKSTEPSLTELSSNYQPDSFKSLPEVINSSNAKKILHNPLLQNYYDSSLACRAGWFVEFTWLQYDRRSNVLSCVFCSQTTSNGSLAVGREPLKTRRIDLTVHSQTDTHIQIADHFISGKDNSSDVINVQSSSKFCNLRKILLKKNDGIALRSTRNSKRSPHTLVDSTTVPSLSPTNSLLHKSAKTTSETENLHVFSPKSSSCYQPQNRFEGNGNVDLPKVPADTTKSTRYEFSKNDPEKSVTNYTIPQVLSKQVIEKIMSEDGHSKRVDNYMAHYKVKLDWFKEFDWLEFKTCSNRFFCKYCKLHNTSSIFARGKFAMASRSKRNDFIIHMETDMHKNVMIASGLEKRLGNNVSTVCFNPRHNFKDFVDEIDLNIRSGSVTGEQSNTHNQVRSSTHLSNLHNLVHNGSYIAGAPVINDSTNQSSSDFQPSSTVNETVIVKTENKSRKNKKNSSVIVIEPDEEPETDNIRSDSEAVDQNQSNTDQLEDYFDISLSNYLAGKTDECNVKSLDLGTANDDSPVHGLNDNSSTEDGSSLNVFDNKNSSNQEKNDIGESVQTSVCKDYSENGECDSVYSTVQGLSKVVDSYTGNSDTPSTSTAISRSCVSGNIPHINTNKTGAVESKESIENKQNGATSLKHTKQMCDSNEGSPNKLKETPSSYKFVSPSTSDLVVKNRESLQQDHDVKVASVCGDNTVTESSSESNKSSNAEIRTFKQLNGDISKQGITAEKITENKQSNKDMDISSSESNDTSEVRNIVSNTDPNASKCNKSSRSISDRPCGISDGKTSADIISHAGLPNNKYVPFHHSFWTVANMLRQQQVLCDVTLATFTHTGHLVRFPTHQLILFCASEYLKQKITSSPSSGKKKTFVFPNITASGLKGVVDFLYGQNVIGDAKYYKECYHAAQVLGISSAQTVFRSFISSHSSDEELVEVVLGLPSAARSQNVDDKEKENTEIENIAEKVGKLFGNKTSVEDHRSMDGRMLTENNDGAHLEEYNYRCKKRARTNSTHDQEPEMKKSITEYRFCSKNSDTYSPAYSHFIGADLSNRSGPSATTERLSLTKIINVKCYICRKKGQKVVMNIGNTKPWETWCKGSKNTGHIVCGKVIHSMNRCRDCAKKLLYGQRVSNRSKRKYKYSS